MSMTKAEFRKRWESDDNGGGITYEDIADCAVAWGIKLRLRTAGEVTDEVLQAAGVEAEPGLDADAVLESLGRRLSDADHLVASALIDYKNANGTEAIKRKARRMRALEAKDGKYLRALIHDEIYRMHGGED